MSPTTRSNTPSFEKVSRGFDHTELNSDARTEPNCVVSCDHCNSKIRHAMASQKGNRKFEELEKLAINNWFERGRKTPFNSRHG